MAYIGLFEEECAKSASLSVVLLNQCSLHTASHAFVSLHATITFYGYTVMTA